MEIHWNDRIWRKDQSIVGKIYFPNYLYALGTDSDRLTLRAICDRWDVPAGTLARVESVGAN